MNQTRILVVAAHPDDEVLGAGGTIARHAQSGAQVHLLFLTDGVGARGDNAPGAARRADAARAAAHILGAEPPRMLRFPDNRLDSVDLLDLVQAIETVIAEIQPQIVYTHHHGDLNIDHALCHRAVMTACRPLAASPVRTILAMEVPSSTEWNAPVASDAFMPQYFTDISSVLALKLAAIAAYEEEMRAFPHPRSARAIEALAQWRGAAAGLAAAEAFMILRHRWLDDSMPEIHTP